MDLVLGGTRLKMGTDGSRRWGAPGHPAHGMETMTTTSYRLDDIACDADGLSVFDLVRYRCQDDAVTGARCRPQHQRSRRTQVPLLNSSQS